MDIPIWDPSPPEVSIMEIYGLGCTQGLGSREVTSDANHGMPPLSDAYVPYFHAAWFPEDVCPLGAGRHPCSFGGYVLGVAW